MSDLPTIRRILVIALALGLCTGSLWAQSSKPGARGKDHVSGKKKSAKKGARKKKTRRPRGQQGIASTRVREIQQALIEAKYLNGEPSGVWDDPTRNAMARFQGDNGWQTKVLPDFRALIKLGLGPDHSNLINPDTAVTAAVPAGPNRQ